MTDDSPTTDRFLERPQGRIAYEVAGTGPLVVCVPGMGELRSSYRTTAPALVAAGFAVATMDLRGHGDSDATFTAYDDVAAGGDLLSLVEHLDAHRAEILASMRRPGHAAAFRRTTRTSHAPVEARLDDVHAPALVVMGERDPDFADRAAEARWIADRLSGEVLLVPGAGHYPQVEAPDVVSLAVVDFARRVTARA